VLVQLRGARREWPPGAHTQLKMHSYAQEFHPTRRAKRRVSRMQAGAEVLCGRAHPATPPHIHKCRFFYSRPGYTGKTDGSRCKVGPEKPPYAEYHQDMEELASYVHTPGQRPCAPRRAARSWSMRVQCTGMARARACTRVFRNVGSDARGRRRSFIERAARRHPAPWAVCRATHQH